MLMSGAMGAHIGAPLPESISAMAQTPSKSKRWFEWSLILLLPVAIAITARFENQLFDLTQRIPFSPSIQMLILVNINLLLIILLFFILARNIIRLLIERQDGVPGAQLRTKLVVAFAGMSLLPTALLFMVASGFISTSIDNWFNTQIESSLEESLDVARTYYQNSATNALYYADQLARIVKEEKLLNQENLPRLREVIAQKQQEYNLGIVEVFSSTQEELVRASNPQLPKGEITAPSSDLLRKAMLGERSSRVVPAGKADLIRGIVPIYSNWNPQDIVGALVVNYYVPYSLTSKMNEISTNFDQYKSAKQFKSRVQKVYITVLFLIVLVVLFLSTWVGFRLAKGITDPIQDLAEATERVAGGDLTMALIPHSNDEIGYLVTAFNAMTADLRHGQESLQAANRELETSNQEIEARRLYMEIVLKNVTAGVLSIDRNGHILTINQSAERLLHLNGQEVIRRNFFEVLGSAHFPLVRDFISQMAYSGKDSLRQIVPLTVEENELVLQVTVTALRDEAGEVIGSVIVFDDLTQLQKAQRMAAWREVAKRIAHEIKNPLTPIQLSAQRLRRRYLERLGPEETVFDECTAMIIKQVDELKKLVNEFSSFARMPTINPALHNLNTLIEQTLVLFRQGHREIEFIFTPDLTLPEVSLDAEQITRVLINLIDNSIAASAGQGQIKIETGLDRALGMVSFAVSDQGCGISGEDKLRLFEPYFSTKKSGTGLGLAIVATIVADHHGYIRVRDNQPRGSRFIVELPIKTPDLS